MDFLEEKVLILGSLFHDIGKFLQICLSEDKNHTELGAQFIKDNPGIFKKVLDNDEQRFEHLCKIVEEHHNQDSNDELVKIINIADKASAEENSEDGKSGSASNKSFPCINIFKH